MSGWIKLYRSLRDWQYYDDQNATRLLIHLLISVNYEHKRWRGVEIPAGSMVLSWETLSKDIGLTIKQCRGAMKKLEKSGEVVRKRAGKGQLVALTKWDELQSEGREKSTNRAGKGQEKGRKGATTKESKEIKEVKESKNVPVPSLTEVIDYFNQNGYTVAGAKQAFEYYQKPMEETGGKVWKDSKGATVKNWKQKMRGVWFRDEFKKTTGNTAADYENMKA